MAQDVFRVTTDGHGWRGLLSIDEAEVLVFGDSFAFGYGVDDGDCFTEHCGGIRVKSLASPAHSMVHNTMQMHSLAAQLPGKTVIWLIYGGNDLSDNLHPNLGATRVPFLRRRDDGSWETVAEHVSQEPWTFASQPRDNDRLFAEMCTPSPYQERVFSAADHLIGQAADLCASAGARLVVVSVPPTSMIKDPESLAARAATPRSTDLRSADHHLASSCAARGVTFLPLAPRLRPRHYWPEDMHWNPAGHRLVGAVIRQVLHRSVRH